MPSFDIVKEIKPESSFRVSAIVSNFDLDIEHLEEHYTGEITPPDDWKVGLIVGGVGYRKDDNSERVFPGGLLRRIRVYGSPGYRRYAQSRDKGYRKDLYLRRVFLSSLLA